MLNNQESRIMKAESEISNIVGIGNLVNQGLCTGCGVCVSNLKGASMILNRNGFIVPGNIDTNTADIKLCPFNPLPEGVVQDEDVLASSFLKDASEYHLRLGKFRSTYVGYSEKYRNSSSSGGVATYIFEYLLRFKIVDSVYIVSEVNGSYSYQWFDDYKQISIISKTRYYPVTLERLFKEIDEKGGKVAVSGVACFVKAIRLKQYYYSDYKSKIPFVVGIICGGLKSKYYTDYLAQKAGIKGEYNNAQYRIKNVESVALDYSFGAFDSKSTLKSVRMSTLGDMWGTGLFKEVACDFCDDVTTELADISLGDAWIQPFSNDGRGTNVIIARSKLAEEILEHGKQNSELIIENLEIEAVIQSQKSSFLHRQDALDFRRKKRQRSGLLVPKNRSKYFVEIPFYYAWVQNQRMRVRARSLQVWRKVSSASEFDSLIKKDLIILSRLTTLYHRLRRVLLLLKLKV